MVDEWIAESVRDSGGKCQKIIFWKIQGRDDFVINGSMEKFADHRIVHAVSYDILAGQISAEYEGGMRTIQNANLSLLIRLVIVCDQNWKICLVDREFLQDRLWSLNDPEAERFSGIEQLILIAKLSADCVRFLAWVSGHDTVDQRRTEQIFFPDPVRKCSAELPLVGIAQDAVLQLFSIIINQLTGKNQEAFSLLHSEFLKPAVKKLRQLSGKRAGRSVSKLTGRIVYDTGFSCVGDEKTQLRVGSTVHQLFIIALGIQAAADAGYDARLCLCLTILTATKQKGIESVLCVDPVRGCRVWRGWLANDDLCVKPCLLI